MSQARYGREGTNALRSTGQLPRQAKKKGTMFFWLEFDAL
jgi:hypothetical protein